MATANLERSIAIFMCAVLAKSPILSHTAMLGDKIAVPTASERLACKIQTE